MTLEKVLVELILGHRAVIREKETPEGFTHDWEVYVKSEQGNINPFVDRIIFNLHESFPKPRRVVKDPPFIVRESGYAGFIIKIEILFKNKEEPKRAEFDYDLYLQSTGGPITPSRKEKLIFNFPSEEFAKKLFKGGGSILEKSSHSSSSSGIGSQGNFSAGSAALVPQNNSSGGKASKHASANAGSLNLKQSPKNSFETLFGTPIKRPSAPSLTTSSSASTGPPSLPGKTGKPGKGGKSDKIFGDTTGGNKGGINEKPEKSSKSSLSPSPEGPSPLLGLDSSRKQGKSSSKSSSRRSSGEKKEKGGGTKNMLPPNNTSVPKKAKKSDIFESPPSTDGSKKSDKGKKKGTSKEGINIDDNNEGIKDIKMERVEAIIKKSKNMERNLSPIPGTSSSSSSSCSSPSANSSEEESESEPELKEQKPSRRNSPIHPTVSTTKKRSRRSPSPASVASPASSSSSTTSSVTLPPSTKKRKGSVSSITSDGLIVDNSQVTTKKMHKFDKSSSSSTQSTGRRRSSEHREKRSKGKKSSHKEAMSSYNRKSGSDISDKRSSYADTVSSENSIKLSKKPKKSSLKEKVFQDSNSDLSDSSSDEVSSHNGSNGIGGMSGNTTIGGSFSHAVVAGSMTAEMRLLKDLHSRIATLEDPEKLDQVVTIVENSGIDCWTVETGITFDFDLCKLNSATIKKLQHAILL